MAWWCGDHWCPNGCGKRVAFYPNTIGKTYHFKCTECLKEWKNIDDLKRDNDTIEAE
jgi:hypothetical protein